MPDAQKLPFILAAQQHRMECMADKTIKIDTPIDATLYSELVAAARENGQSERVVLESAIEHYLHHVLPSQNSVRTEVIEAHRLSNEKFRKLYEKLAE